MSEWRRPMTPSRMKRIWEREGGLCGECRKPVPMRGPEVRYDHRIPGEICLEDKDENVFPLHREGCDKPKFKCDMRDIAKAKRLHKRHNGEKKPPTLKGRPFPKGQSRPIPSRGWGR